MTDLPDSWSSGIAYDRFMGRWSRGLATRFVSWLHPAADLHWLDVGCGTGALSEAICQMASPASVVGCDPSAAFVECARSRSTDRRASFVVARTGELPGRTGAYTAVSSLLALNFFPDPVSALREMRSLTAPGAVVSACVWDYAGGMQLLRHFWNAAALVDAGARELDEGERFPICRADALITLFQSAGLADVRGAPLEIPTPFTDFEDYWHPFLEGTGPAPSFVASLDAVRRTRLAQRLEETLPRRAGGTIPLTARAWAVRGTVRAGN